MCEDAVRTNLGKHSLHVHLVIRHQYKDGHKTDDSSSTVNTHKNVRLTVRWIIRPVFVMYKRGFDGATSCQGACLSPLSF